MSRSDCVETAKSLAKSQQLAPSLCDGGRKNPSRIHYLDFARFFAAAIVALYHFNLPFPSSSGGLLAYGHLGVQFFFLISGFVIAMSARETTTGQFLIKRFIRLAPTFWMAALILGAIKLAGARTDHPMTPLAILGNLTFFSLTPVASALHRDHLVTQPMWTLAYEIYFYVLIALAGTVRTGRNWFICGWLLISAFETFRMGTVSSLEHSVRVYTMYEAAPFFAGGWFLWGLYERGMLRAFEWGALFLCVVLSLKHCYWLGAVMYGWQAPWGPPPPVDAVDVSLVLAFWAFFAVVILSRGAHRNQRPTTLRLELALGAASYPIYLFHPLFVVSMPRIAAILHSQAAAMGLALVATIFIALPVVKYLEKPIQGALRALLLTRPKKWSSGTADARVA